MPGKAERPNIMKRNHTFLTGVYIAVNAIKDAYLVVDGPDCLYKKIEMLEKNHDFCSEIFDQGGKHRICSTMINADDVINGRHSEIKDLLKKIGSAESAGAVFLSSMPMVKITGIQYEMILKKAEENSEKMFINIPYRSLDDDWIDGYSEVLSKTAEGINLAEGKTEKGNVAVVGYMFDRNEGDHIGNINEMKRWMDAIGLNLVSVWPSGCSFEELKKVESADLIVSLPYGKDAAKRISKKTGARVVELEIPFGIENSLNWIKAVASEAGKEIEADKFAEEELNEVMPLMEWIVPAFFQGKSISAVLDPFMAGPFVSAFEEIDVKTVECTLFSREGRKTGLESAKNPPKLNFENDDARPEKEVEFAVGNSDMKKHFPNTKYIEFGFPSYGYHCLSLSPFMGAKGFLLFLNRIINNIS